MAARRRIASRRGWPPNLYQNGTGYFSFRNPETGKTYGLGREFKIAAAEAKAANARLADKSGSSLVNRIFSGERAFGAWCDEYEKIYIETRGSAANTIRTFKSVMRVIKAAPFALVHLRKVTTEEVALFIDSQAAARGDRTGRAIRTYLQDAFREAEIKGLIDTGKNPVTVTRAPEAEVARARLTLEQFVEVHKAAANLPTWVKHSLELAIVTGQRREDVAEMTFAQVRDGLLWVEQTKTKARVRIPVALRLDALGWTLDDVIRRCRNDVVSKWMVHHSTARGCKPGDQVWVDTISKGFTKAYAAAGIEVPPDKTRSTFHEIRSLAARLYSEQYSQDFAQALLGHKTADMTAMYRDVRGAEWIEVKLG